MDTINQKCSNCGELLKPSRYARLKKEGERSKKDTEVLVCRNYPKCNLSEKEVN